MKYYNYFLLRSDLKKSSKDRGHLSSIAEPDDIMQETMAKHLAIFKGDGAEKILSGEKLMESRFSKRKDPPFGVVSAGDLIYIKPSGKDIIGQFRVKKVIFYDGLGIREIGEIRERYEKELAVGEDYWKGKEGSRYGTLIFIGTSSRFITSPIKIKKKDLRGWVVLG